MARDTQEPSLLTVFNTPIKGVKSILVLVPGRTHNPADDPDYGTTYAAALLSTREQVDKYGDFIMTMPAEDGVPEGYLGWWFATPMEDAQKKQAYRTERRFDGKDWPDIVHGIRFPIDRKFPRSQYAAVNGVKTLVSGPSVHVRPIVTPGGTYGSWFTIEHFISTTPYPRFNYETAVPGTVPWDLPGRVGQVTGLHEDIIIPAVPTVTSMVAGDVGNATASVLSGELVPATNQTTWRPQVVLDEAPFQNGFYRRTKITVHPPRLPETITRVA